jgi:hypothetical protein
VRRDRRLADPLARADDAERGQLERLELGRVETEVRADVWEAVREHAARQHEALARAQHGLVGKVDHELRPVIGERAVERLGERDPVVRALAQLLRAAEEVRGNDVVGQLGERRAHHGRVVLAVDERERSHGTSLLRDSFGTDTCGRVW